MTILDTEKLVITSKNESSNNNIMLNCNNSNDDNSLFEELTEGIQYSHIDKFKDYSALNIDYEEFRSSPRAVLYILAVQPFFENVQDLKY